MLVLLMERVYELCRVDGLRCRNIYTVKPIYNGHARGRTNVRNRGVSVKERGFEITLLSYGPKKIVRNREVSANEECPFREVSLYIYIYIYIYTQSFINIDSDDQKLIGGYTYRFIDSKMIS
jgi:hypothetical protein